MVSLAGLPDGSHTLVLAPDFWSRTVFTLTLPTTEPIITARLRSVAPWRSTNLFLKATVHADPQHSQAEAIIRVHIENGTDETLKITEQDICLEAGTSSTSDWGLSPVWRKKAAKPPAETTIKPKESGEIELNWRDWVREGLWYNLDTFPAPRTGPTLPDPKPGEISVRVWVRSHGVLPVALPHPQIGEKRGPGSS